MSSVLIASSGSAVATCALMTALRSSSSSSVAGTILKFAAIGVHKVPQNPDSMPIAVMIAGLPPKPCTSSGSATAAVITGNAAKALPITMVNSAMPSV